MNAAKTLSTLLALVAFALAPAFLLGCESKEDDKKEEKADDKEKGGEEGEEKGEGDDKGEGEAEAEAEGEPETPAEPAPVEIVLVNQDITEQVKGFFNGFKGTKIEMMLPEGVEFKAFVGGDGFEAVLGDPKVFAIEVGLIHETSKVIADVEKGEGLLKDGKIIEKSEDHVIQHGSYFGDEGHSLNLDLEAVGALKTGCRTPTGRLYPEPVIRKMLESCRSFTVTK